MKFEITRTSSFGRYRGKEDAGEICPGAKWELYKSKYSTEYEEFNAVIEMDDLWDFVRKNDPVILSQSSLLGLDFQIEIYDGYRE